MESESVSPIENPETDTDEVRKQLIAEITLLKAMTEQVDSELEQKRRTEVHQPIRHSTFNPRIGNLDLERTELCKKIEERRLQYYDIFHEVAPE
ncbi:MAG TPA: hypothetical protein PK263_05100 [bacterium]|nr:hypothetical protein [bacterium]